MMKSFQKKVRISAPTAPLQQVTDAPTTGPRSKLVRTICQHPEIGSTTITEA